MRQLHYLSLLLSAGSIIATLTGCGNEYYEQGQIKIVDVRSGHTNVFVVYREPLESMYFSSGVDIGYNNDSSIATVRFVRHRIRTKISAEIESKRVEESSYLLSKGYYKLDAFVELKGTIKTIVTNDTTITF